MASQTWNADGYARNARFVTDLGQPVLELLAPRAGERILDVGCGDGVLTQKIAHAGCAVVGVDASRELAAAARRLGLEVVETCASACDQGFAIRAASGSPITCGCDSKRNWRDRAGAMRLINEFRGASPSAAGG